MSEAQRRSPYQGLIPYDEKDAPFFFGREKETRVITANLFASRLTLLYGASGVGKSSVLQAGVAHHLRPRKDLLVVVFNAWQNDPLSNLRAAVASAAAPAAGESDPLPDSASLAEYLAEYSAKLNCRLMIILDQFEEYFLYHGQQDSQGTFDVEFPRAVNRPGLRVNFLISIRQDALAELDRRFKGRITNLFNNRLEVKHLSREAARDAIEKPKDEYNRLHAAEEPVVIEEKLIEEVLRQVETGQVVIGEAGRGVVKTDAAEPRIETPYLQLVMTRLWEEGMRQGSRILRLETLSRLGDTERSGAQNIVRTHLDAVMSTLPSEEREIAARIFLHLVTPSGTKIAHIAPDLAELADVNQTQLSSLVEKLSDKDARILRTVAPPLDRPDTPRYEIFHDVLAPAILDWRSRHELAEVERRAAVEAAKRERDATRQRELEQAQALALEQGRRAESERQRAEEQEQRAEAERLLKEEQERRAEVEHRRAEEQEQRAETERLLKEEQKQRAETERRRAEERARAARNRLWLSIALGVMLVVATVLAGFLYDQSKKAKANAREAQTQAKLAAENAGLATRNERIAMAVANVNIELLARVEELTGFTADGVDNLLRSFDERLKSYQKLNDIAGQGTILFNIAGVYRAWGQTLQDKEQYQQGLDKYQKALHYYQDALDKLRSLGADLPLIGYARNDMGAAYQDQGEYAKAEQLFDEAKAILEKLLLDNTSRPESPDLVPVLYNLAECYRLQGKFAAAELLYTRALTFQQDTLPSDHPNIARILDQLGALYADQYRLEKAKQNFRKAQTIWEMKVNSPSKEEAEASRSLGNSYYDLADVYRKERNFARAEEALNLAMKNHNQFKDRYQLDVARDRARLARVYYDQGRYAKAGQLFINSLRVLEKGLGPGHPDAALVRSNLASLYGKQGNTKAKDLFKEALDVQQIAIPYHPDLAETLENYAALLRKLNQQDEEAAKMEERAKAIRDKHMVEDPKD